MIRQNSGGSGGSGVQHLTAIGSQDDYTLNVPGFQGTIEDVAVIVVSQAVNLMAAPPTAYAAYEFIDLANGKTYLCGDTSFDSSTARASCNVTDGVLEIGNNTNSGIPWDSVSYAVTIYMK